ncbi:MAG: PDZ domain-containing protein [Candidatus Heimdallarchaeota archaeon]
MNSKVVKVPKGPAKSVGIEPGDIIIAIDDKEINSIQILTQKIVKKRIGEEVKIRYVRNGQTFESIITLGKAPA